MNGNSAPKGGLAQIAVSIRNLLEIGPFRNAARFAQTKEDSLRYSRLYRESHPVPFPPLQRRIAAPRFTGQSEMRGCHILRRRCAVHWNLVPSMTRQSRHIQNLQWLLVFCPTDRRRASGRLACCVEEIPDWDITTPELKTAWERGEHDRFYPYGKTYGQAFREQE